MKRWASFLPCMGQYDKALEYYLKHFRLRRTIRVNIRYGQRCNNNVIVYTYLKDYDNAIHSYRTADSLSAVDK
ncbi:MAG: hypothetical protein IPN26_17660 [Bacteroidetes bacterium]|nr:hypothetical protein [Bacteroidota bacterium]